MIDIRSTLYRLETSYSQTRGTLNDRYKVYTLQTRDFIPGGTLMILGSTLYRLETSYLLHSTD